MNAFPAFCRGYFQCMMVPGTLLKTTFYFLLILTQMYLCDSADASGLQVIDKKVMVAPLSVKWHSGTAANEQLRALFKADQQISWKKKSTESDRNGKEHTRYQQLVNGIPVVNAVIVLHLGGGTEDFVTGTFINFAPAPESIPDLDNKRAAILDRFLPEGGELQNDTDGSGWYWILADSAQTARLGFIVNYFPINSLHKHTIVVDAASLTLINETYASCYADVPGTAVTSYQGVKTITCFADSGQFYLKSTTRGLGIITKNLNHNLNYQHISEFTDTDNYWLPGTTTDNHHATDAHYCAEQYYDYLITRFNRNSLDNNGYRLVSYLNYGTTMANAFWNGQAVVYGSGNTTTGPLTTPDIAGHEFTHGLIQKTANLAYSGEPGTINEALSDIFGAALEHYTNPLQADWTIGEMAGTPLRSIMYPGDFNQPAFYHGNFWYYGSGDQGGVHINSGFINKWFYILTSGEQGINESGMAYNVNGIGMTASMDLIYHTLTSYLLSNTGFFEFYQYTLQSAVDLYGNCSPQYQAVLKSWEAVGFGSTNAIPQIMLPATAQFCAGDSVMLHVNHQPGSTYEWFHDGTIVSGAATSEIYATAAGDWQVKISRCGQLYVADPVSLNHFPVVQVTTQDLEICKGPPAVLEGFPEGGVFSIPNPYYGNSTSFQYIYTDSNGCESVALGHVEVHDIPEVTMLTSSLMLPQNAGPLLLQANVPGIFLGSGVSGNHFFPETTGVGGPYPVYIFYSNQHGCSAHDSILIEVTKPCIREYSHIQIQTPDSIITPGKLLQFHVNATGADFLFRWEFPDGSTIMGSADQPYVNVIWGSAGGPAVLELTNSCGEVIRLEYMVSLDQPAALTDVSIYPNPAKGIVFVQLSGYDDFTGGEIRISDISGKQVLHLKTTSLLQQINIQELPGGYYLVEISNGKQFIRKHFIVN